MDHAPHRLVILIVYVMDGFCQWLMVHAQRYVVMESNKVLSNAMMEIQ